MSSANDPNVVRQQFETDENLRIRQETHAKYTIPQIDFTGWALTYVPWHGDEKVLDIGCGPGTYYTRMMEVAADVNYVGMDLSFAMLHSHPLNNHCLMMADAQTLPFEDDSFDVVMANHMLYHIPDIDAALKEIKRVLKPEGILMAATNSIHTMPELQVLMRRAIVLLSLKGAAQVHPPAMPSDDFALENGTRILAGHFFAVVRHDLPSQLVFDEIDPAMSYLESTRELRESYLPEDVAWEDVMLIMRQQITQLIKHLGKLEINKLSGMLMASNAGGFIHEFASIQKQAETTA